MIFKSRLQSLWLHNVCFSLILRPLFWRSPFSLYSYLKCISALHLYNHWSSFGCFSHQGFAGSGRMCCKLWEYCSGVILPLMRAIELVQCIKCGGDDYFIWIFPFFFPCTSLSPLVFCLLVQVTCLKPSEVCSLFRLLRRSPSSVSILGLVLN